MTEENIRQLFRYKGKEIPPEPKRFSDIRKKIADTDDGALKELINVPYKSVVATVLFSVFLGNFGAARFYLGDVKGGLTRLFTVLGLYLFPMLFLLIPELGIYIYNALAIIFSIVFFIWWLFDIVACLGEAREQNYWRLITKIAHLNGTGIEAMGDGHYEIPKPKKSRIKTAAKVFIVLSMISGCLSILPLIFGGITLSKLKSAKRASQLIPWGILSLFFCGWLSGILVLCIKDKDLQNNVL